MNALQVNSGPLSVRTVWGVAPKRCSTSSQLALGLWWQEKARQTLTDYNLAAKNENMVKRFDFDNPANATDHSAYLAGATLKKQAQQAQRWLTPLAASHPEAADALGSLRFQGLLP
jgi:hypothetical protein